MEKIKKKINEQIRLREKTLSDASKMDHLKILTASTNQTIILVKIINLDGDDFVCNLKVSH